jgi:hypothetical protein
MSAAPTKSLASFSEAYRRFKMYTFLSNFNLRHLASCGMYSTHAFLVVDFVALTLSGGSTALYTTKLAVESHWTGVLLYGPVHDTLDSVPVLLVLLCKQATWLS